MHLTMLPMSLRIFNRPHPFFFFGQQQTTPFEGPDQIIIGNGQGLNINFSGVTSFKSPFNSQIPLVLNNLLFVPSITKNLMSVSQFCIDNLCFLSFILSFAWSNLRSLKRSCFKCWFVLMALTNSLIFFSHLDCHSNLISLSIPIHLMFQNLSSEHLQILF